MSAPDRRRGAARPARAAAAGDDNPLDLIAALRAGRASGGTLSPRQREACVEHLAIEGLTGPETAKVLGVSVRTVERCRARVRARHAAALGPGLAREAMAVYLAQTERAVARIRGAARAPGAGPTVVVQAERAVAEIQAGVVDRLHRLGYGAGAGAPAAGGGPPMTLDEAEAELARLRALGPPPA